MVDPDHVIRPSSLWNLSKVDLFNSADDAGVGFGNWASDGELHKGMQTDKQCQEVTESSLNTWIDMVDLFFFFQIQVPSQNPNTDCFGCQGFAWLHRFVDHSKAF